MDIEKRTIKYSVGGTILSGMIGAYIGYKIGRARPQKKGFSTEKRIGRNIKKSFSKKKYSLGGQTMGLITDEQVNDLSFDVNVETIPRKNGVLLHEIVTINEFDLYDEPNINFYPFHLIYGSSSLAIFDALGVDEVAGLTRKDCEEFINDLKSKGKTERDDAFIAGLVNYSGDNLFMFFNVERLSYQGFSNRVLPHEALHLSRNLITLLKNDWLRKNLNKPNWWEDKRAFFVDMNSDNEEFFAETLERTTAIATNGWFRVTGQKCIVDKSNKLEHGGEIGIYEAHKANIKYLESISEMEKMKILKNIANHYGISVNEAQEEVTYNEAEYLYEYIANDSSLRMKVYQEMKGRKMAKGGMTEHGLEIGDEIMGYTKDVNELHVVNRKNNDEWHSVDLDDGKRYEGGGGVQKDAGKVYREQMARGSKVKSSSSDKKINEISQKEFGKNYDELNVDEQYFCDIAYAETMNSNSQQMSRGGGISGLNDLIRG
jgi:hypothetical protein